MNALEALQSVVWVLSEPIMLGALLASALGVLWEELS